MHSQVEYPNDLTLVGAADATAFHLGTWIQIRLGQLGATSQIASEH